MQRTNWFFGELQMIAPPVGGGKFFYQLTMDLEVDGLGWIVRTESVDGEYFEWGKKVPVWYAFLDEIPPPQRDKYSIMAGSNKIGVLYPAALP